MFCTVNSVFTFKIESAFDKWATIFDSAEAIKTFCDQNFFPFQRSK